MNLINKLKNTGKALALVGGLASPVYFGGCLLTKEIPDRWDIFGVDAAKTQNHEQIKNRINVEVDESRKEGVNTYKQFYGDLNGDGKIEPYPLITYGEKIFSNYEDFGFRIVLYNKPGKIVYLTILRKGDLQIIEEQKILVDEPDFQKDIKSRIKLNKGNYYGKIEIENQVFGVKEIEVID